MENINTKLLFDENMTQGTQTSNRNMDPLRLNQPIKYVIN